jgi:hypothetical protein
VAVLRSDGERGGVVLVFLIRVRTEGQQHPNHVFVPLRPSRPVGSRASAACNASSAVIMGTAARQAGAAPPVPRGTAADCPRRPHGLGPPCPRAARRRPRGRCTRGKARRLSTRSERDAKRDPPVRLNTRPPRRHRAAWLLPPLRSDRRQAAAAPTRLPLAAAELRAAEGSRRLLDRPVPQGPGQEPGQLARLEGGRGGRRPR